MTEQLISLFSGITVGHRTEHLNLQDTIYSKEGKIDSVHAQDCNKIDKSAVGQKGYIAHLNYKNLLPSYKLKNITTKK